MTTVFLSLLSAWVVVLLSALTPIYAHLLTPEPRR